MIRLMKPLVRPTSAAASLASLACAALLVTLATTDVAALEDTSLCDPSTESCRTIEVQNNCGEQVWIGTMGSSVQCQSDDDCPTATSTCDLTTSTCNCTQDSDCGSTVCDTSASPNQCRFRRAFGGGIELASGASETAYVPHTPPSSGSIISWGGRFWARTGCPDFATCGVVGALCSEDSECCTNAGCAGVFQCQANTDCSTWSCTTNADCPGGSTCDVTNTCNGCVSGTCACQSDTDCRDGGTCNGGLCSGQCGPNGIACQTGDCDSQSQCPVGVGGLTPATLAEFTLQKGSANFDYYDVSLVDGFNVPLGITPLNPRKSPKAGASAVTLWCGSPGCADATSCQKQSQASCPDYASCLCEWDVDQSSCPNAMRVVWPMACEDDSDCGGGTCDTSTVPHACTCKKDGHCPGAAPTCGVNANIALKRKRVCGTYVGCASPAQSCAFASKLKVRDPGDGPFRCSDWSDLYACTGANSGSCYTNGAGSDCCGCPPWSPGGNQGPFPESGSCQNSNKRWNRRVEPFVATFKDACPTAYSFQYDDPTSTYNCSGTSVTRVGYQVTVCPCGSPGALACAPPPG